MSKIIENSEFWLFLIFFSDQLLLPRIFPDAHRPFGLAKHSLPAFLQALNSGRNESVKGENWTDLRL
jgi:hypothetical protein